jgi:DNA repair photolyase
MVMKMPSCGSQCYLCDLPVRFDTYDGCSHGCEYCFAKKFKDISLIKNKETAKTLLNFIQGKRGKDTNWCDWNIPIHWGGLSDPFQPCEKSRKVSLECLKVLKETQYPFVVSTKGELVVEDEYLNLLSQCNCVVQISMVCKSYDKLELGCPGYERRLEMLKILSSRVKRTIVRIQPYMHEVFDEVYNNLEAIKEAGAYGVIIEGMKYRNKKPGLVKVGADFTYPYEVIKTDFLKLKQKAHDLGLKIYAGENRLRKYGDSLTCCGIDGMEGFIPNTFNLNHLLNNDKAEPSTQQKQKKTGNCFRAMEASTIKGNIVDENSFAYNMLNFYKKKRKNIDEIMGVNKK